VPAIGIAGEIVVDAATLCRSRMQNKHTCLFWHQPCKACGK
jgi:hypothetical protein